RRGQRIVDVRGGEGEGVGAVVVGRRGVAEAAQGGVDRRQGAGHRQRGAAVAAGVEGEAGGGAQGQHALGDAQLDALRGATGRGVGDRDQVAVAGREDQGGVFRRDLGGRGGVGRRGVAAHGDG